jgi:hypothetical protein
MEAERSNLVQETQGSVVVRMFFAAVKDEAETLKLGRPIFKMEPQIEKICDGGSHIVCRKVREQDKREFSDLWKRLNSDSPSSEIAGTPLREWSELSLDVVNSLRASHIYTLEQLSSIADSELQVLGLGGRELRKKAKAYIDVAKKQAKVSQMVAENAKLQRDLDAKQSQIDFLSKKLDELEKKLT